MSYYFPNVDPAFVYRRQGTTDDPYLFRHETGTVSQGIVTLIEIPNYTNKVIAKKLDNTALTETTNSTLTSNQYRVDYSTGVVYLHSSLENLQLTFDYYGTGYVAFPASRVYVDTAGNNTNKSMQQLITDLDNSKTHWLSAVMNYSDIATTYPAPLVGDTVQTISDNKIYRYQNGSWVFTQQYSASAITDVQNKIGNITSLQTTNKNDLVSAVNEHETQIGDLTLLNTTAKNNLVTSINEHETQIGDISTLKTTAKTSLTVAVNEHDDQIGDIASLQTTAKTSLVNAVNENKNNIGDIVSLQTANKTNLVSAINEVQSETDSANSGVATLNTNVGTLSTLSTTTKSSIVAAINEHVGKINNPHAVTASQVGAYTTTQTDSTFAKKTQPAWINAVLQNQWTPDQSRPARYFKDEMGFVHVEGDLTGGYSTGSPVLFNLPAGYRPERDISFAIFTYKSDLTVIVAELLIKSTGDVMMNKGDYTAYVHLGHRVFRAYQ